MRRVLVRAAGRRPRRRCDRCAHVSPADGREIRLAGIEPVAGARKPTALRRCPLSSRGASDIVGRRRQPRPLRPPARFRPSRRLRDAGAKPAAGAGRGAGIGRCRRQGLRRTLIAAEAEARRAKRGTWADPAAIKNAESPGDILAGIGRFTVVEGRVLSVRQAGATTYLNFGRNWTRDFAVTISRRAAAALDAAGIALSHWRIDGFGSVAGSRRGAARESRCSGWGRLKCLVGISRRVRYE